MAPNFGRDVLAVFDVWEDTREFLYEVIESRSAPAEETRRLFDWSLIGGAEDWHHLIDCARSARLAHGSFCDELHGRDVLTYVWHILEGLEVSVAHVNPWEETDRLITVARGLAKRVEIRPPTFLAVEATASSITDAKPRAKGKRSCGTSHYWGDKTSISDGKGHLGKHQEAKQATPPSLNLITRPFQQPCLGQATLPEGPGSGHTKFETSSRPSAHFSYAQLLHQSTCGDDESCSVADAWEAGVRTKKPSVSPYFPSTTSTDTKLPFKRPAPGRISCIPFPPLSAPFFGLIQETYAHEPFWLLIAVTFLIKTAGTLAIPAFHAVKERFPTPSELADPANVGELTGMIRHLGLSGVRVAYMHRYAHIFLKSPPKAGVRHRVRNYDKRDLGPSVMVLNEDPEEPKSGRLTPERDDGDAEAWEIGHMTKGKYAIDSWRIFCRDELLGRAEDWNGRGREAEFQPEWMRVMPHDKELRACLRWMWMREGWEWDPVTGQRTVLRDELRRAVDEGRVEYDDAGGLRMLYEPRAV